MEIVCIDDTNNYNGLTYNGLTYGKKYNVVFDKISSYTIIDDNNIIRAFFKHDYYGYKNLNFKKRFVNLNVYREEVINTILNS